MSPEFQTLFFVAAIVAFVIGIVYVGVPKVRNATTWLFVGLILVVVVWLVNAWDAASF